LKILEKDIKVYRRKINENLLLKNLNFKQKNCWHKFKVIPERSGFSNLVKA
jgi:hypothetical protein